MQFTLDKELTTEYISMQWCNQCIHIEFEANGMMANGIKKATDENQTHSKQLYSGGNTFDAGAIGCCQCRLCPPPHCFTLYARICLFDFVDQQIGKICFTLN